MIQKIKKILKERSMKKEQNRQDVWHKIIHEWCDENYDFSEKQVIDNLLTDHNLAFEIAQQYEYSDIAEQFDIDEIARHIDRYDIACEFDVYDIACEIDIGDIVYNLDYDDICQHLDHDQIAETVESHLLDDVCSNVEDKVSDEIQEKIIELFEDNFAAALSDMRDNIIDDVTTEIGMRLANIGECE